MRLTIVAASFRHNLQPILEPLLKSVCQQAAVGVPPTLPLVPLQSPRTNTMEGFVWALVILGAIRLGRRQAEDTFLDYDAIRVILSL